MAKRIVKKYPQHNIFKEEDKKIFKYSDGTRVRGIDPLDVSIALGKTDFDWQAVAVRAETGDVAAIGEMVEFARKVFKLGELEELEDGTTRGVSSSDVINTLLDFIDYLDTIKKNTSDNPTSPQSTDIPQK